MNLDILFLSSTIIYTILGQRRPRGSDVDPSLESCQLTDRPTLICIGRLVVEV